MDRPLIKQAQEIPNIFGYIRILLVPEFIWLSVIGERNAALLVLLLSAFSDMLDGHAARKLGLITPLGKVLDPVADKLTQLAVIGCLAARYDSVLALLMTLAAKEISAAVCSAVLLRSGGKPFDSLWFGKVTTGALYIYSGILLITDLNETVVLWMTAVTSVIVLMTFILYTYEFLTRIMDIKSNTPR